MFKQYFLWLRFGTATLLVALFLLFHSKINAQLLGNEWIVPGQTYIKLSTAQNGIYGLSYAALSSKSNNIGADPRNIQLYHRGIQQAIFIKGEEDGTFDPGDSIFFYGERNDGTLDSLLYEPHSAQPHKYYNLFSDTTAYFLTWGTSTGKRMQVLPSADGGSPVLFHMNELLLLFTDYYHTGHWDDDNGDYSALSTGEYGEGFYTGKGIPQTLFKTFNNVYYNGPSSKFEILLVGQEKVLHKVKIVLSDSKGVNKEEFLVPDFIGKAPNDKGSLPMYFSTAFDTKLIGADGSLKVTVTYEGTVVNVVGAYYMKVSYPQKFVMNGKDGYFFIGSETDNSQIQISNTSSSSLLYDITDKNNLKIISSQNTDSTMSAGIRASGSVTKLYLNTSGNILSIPKIQQVSLNNYLDSKPDFLIITHPKLRSGSKEYAQYRASAKGGRFDTLIAEIDKLYDQFSYGEKSPSAITQFCKYLLSVSQKPRYLFIIGKGVDWNYPADNNRDYRKYPQVYTQATGRNYIEDLVPPAGCPASDALYTMGIKGFSSDPYVPKLITSRLPARFNIDVQNYLQKVKEHEDSILNPNALWRKHLIHLSGGETVSQAREFQDVMLELKSIVESPPFGGKVVKSFTKNTAKIVDDSFKQTVPGEVNKGLSYITFLGHSGTTTSDIDIGFVSDPLLDYKNKGKYPMLLINGCSSGNSFVEYSFVEDWLVTPNKGALMALGHTDAALDTKVISYADLFYNNAFSKKEYFSRSIGEIQLETIKNSIVRSTSDIGLIASVEEMVLQGDPAIKIYSPVLPDYKIDSAFIKSFNNKSVTAISDSFLLGIVVSNVGLITDSSPLLISIEREVKKTSAILNYTKIFPPVLYQDTLYFTIKSKDPLTFGENIFNIKLDPYDAIPEMDSLNNLASINYFMPLSGVNPLFPKEFSIVSEQPVTLIAQSTNLMIDEQEYLFELDTSYLFNSPFNKVNQIKSGALVKWENILLKLNIPQNDSTVYYWRVRYNTSNIADTLWGESSFTYINKSPEGWAQSRAAQYEKDQLLSLQANKSKDRLEFYSESTLISVRTCYASSVNPLRYPYIKVGSAVLWDQARVSRLDITCGSKLILATFSKATGLPYNPKPAFFSCGIVDKLGLLTGFDISVTGSGGNGNPGQAELIDYINSVNEGDYVLILSDFLTNMDKLTVPLKTLIKTTLGAKQIDNLEANSGYMLLARKGKNGFQQTESPLIEKVATTANDVITDSSPVLGQKDRGTITSTLIGPASKWTKLFHTIYEKGTSTYVLNIIGVDKDGSERIISNNIRQDSLSLDFINAETYPYIKLQALLTDTATLTPPVFKKWLVVYSGVPEGTMDPSKAGLDNYKLITKQEGEKIKINYDFENISNLDFPDSLKVIYYINDKQVGETNIGKLKKGAGVTFNFEFDTRGYGESNILRAFVNPHLQPEEYFDNNILEVPFKLIKDKTNPLLDVVFDGNHIMDGDIISPNPFITITLKDENKYLFLNSASNVEFYVIRPGSQTPERIDTTNSDIIKYGKVPGDANKFVIEYNPKNLAAGVYTFIVKGKDASQNGSGAEYTIHAEVVTETTITNFYPYPNPFSSSTRFVFDLTGNAPDDLKIQIMTVTGKVVRELMKADLGTLEIGRGKMTRPWDGTDEFGDKLANGVYLYRVVIKNAQDFKHRNTAADKAFKNGFGKLYILR